MENGVPIAHSGENKLMGWPRYVLHW